MTKKHRTGLRRAAQSASSFASRRQFPCDLSPAGSSPLECGARWRRPRAPALLVSLALPCFACANGADAPDRGGGAQGSAGLAAADASSGPVDVVLEWNALALQTTGDAPFGLLGQARSLAITHLAMQEALAAAESALPSHGAHSDQRAAQEAATVAAAHRVLSQLHPAAATVLDAALEVSLARIADGAAKETGVTLGEQIADQVLAARAQDGSASPVAHQNVDALGHWQATPPGFLPPLAPHWGSVTPFVLERGDQFRPPPPPELTDARYAQDFNETKSGGAADSTTRSSDRADVARFYTAPGPVFYNPAARQLAEQRGLGLEENAALFARLNGAMADALIACWDAKYHYDFWRPVTAIAAADLDGNPDTLPAPDWTPFIVTPPFPSYPSGHACVGGAARVVLEHEFGPDGFEVTLTSPATPELSRSYHAWQEILDDVNDARIFGGIHFRFDQERGGELGRAVGEYDEAHAPAPSLAPPAVLE